MRLKYLVVLMMLTGYSNMSLAGLALYACTVTSATLNFGNINPYDTTPETSSVTVSVTCNTLLALGANVSYTLTASSGSSGSIASRQMALITNKLNYNIYIDNAYSTIFGNGLNSTGVFTMSYPLPLLIGSRTDSFIIYGRIPVQSIAVRGVYTDTIILTLAYQ